MISRSATRFSCSTFALLLCSTAFASSALPVRSLLEVRQEKVVVQQWDSSCGAAALATVLTHQLGQVVTEREAALGMLRHVEPERVRSRGGFVSRCST
jgi:uncharacterized protein